MSDSTASNSPEALASWQALAALAKRASSHVEADAITERTVRVGPVLIDLSKQTMNDAVVDALGRLAEECDLEAAIRVQFEGHIVNVTENQPVLHALLRTPKQSPDEIDEAIAEERARMLDFAQAVRRGDVRGHTGRPFETVLHIGIGGSHLGPELACRALCKPDLDVRFLANIDGEAVAQALHGLDPETTLVTVASKSFSTLETQQNAATVRAWFIERTCNPQTIGEHFVAITAKPDVAASMGIPPERCFAMWPWVGGRYSLWSSIGLPLAIMIGREGFEGLLAGARKLDEHFRDTPLDRNAPVLLALATIWNANFQGCEHHAVLAYDARLKLLPDYLQQLELESNGKSVRQDGSPVGTLTTPLLWGGEETNGQHAFHQFLHQGTRRYSADLVAVAEPGHAHRTHHDWLLANCLAQGQAMRFGGDVHPPRAGGGDGNAGGGDGKAGGGDGNAGGGDRKDDPLRAHKVVPGGHPVTTILLDELSPEALGVLIALYEQKVFCLGRIWNINSFDQWGVELGKMLAAPLFEALHRSSNPAADASTKGLINAIRSKRN